MRIERFSMGVGDRFGRQGRAQLEAIARAKERGVDIVPVWNKSHREHTIIGSRPADVRAEADRAVAALDWPDSYYVDADHIGLANVGLFLDSSDFFTLDVAEYTGRRAEESDIEEFVEEYAATYSGDLALAGTARHLHIARDDIRAIAEKYLLAVMKAGEIYRRIETAKGAGNFVTEVSMDETDTPQTPLELLFILAAIGREGIPVQTIAPKFSGRFNKGVDYVGDPIAFEREFNANLAVLKFAVAAFGLPANLKLSVHSGSDKFSIYPPIRKAVERHNAGLHLKTAGTTWLEELIGLSLSGPEELDICKSIYSEALERMDELCGPYASVLDIDPARLPAPETVESWDGERFAGALRHVGDCRAFNPDLRQLMHVAYKLAAERGRDFIAAVEANEEVIGSHVAENLYERHIRPLFIG